ncbi:hypothetical protein ACNKHW_10235 [Shigella flexneri]
MHLGHLVPSLCLSRFQQAGHKPVALEAARRVGLVTQLQSCRAKLNTEETVQEWVDKSVSRIPCSSISTVEKTLLSRRTTMTGSADECADLPARYWKTLLR